MRHSSAFLRRAPHSGNADKEKNAFFTSNRREQTRGSPSPLFAKNGKVDYDSSRRNSPSISPSHKKREKGGV